MKTITVIKSVLVAVVLLAPAASRAEDFVTNRLSFSARFGFNITTKFKGATTLPLPTPVPRTTPNGDTYNYDDGYVYPDASGSTDGQTWYWGYDNSASQISGNNVLLSRSTPGRSFTSPSMDSDPGLGCELNYDHSFGTIKGFNFGIEVALNYLNLSFQDDRTYSGTAMRQTDAYPFTPGTTPPGATPANPYQGSLGGPGFVIGTNFTSTLQSVAGGVTISGKREFRAHVLGFRLGPQLDVPVATNFNVWVSGGLAGGLLLGKASWSETVSFGGASARDSGSGTDTRLLWGFFAAANVSWDLSERWSVVGGVQYQNLGVYRHNFGTREAEVDLSKSLFATIGVSRRF